MVGFIEGGFYSKVIENSTCELGGNASNYNPCYKFIVVDDITFKTGLPLYSVNITLLSSGKGIFIEFGKIT